MDNNDNNSWDSQQNSWDSQPDNQWNQPDNPWNQPSPWDNSNDNFTDTNQSNTNWFTEENSQSSYQREEEQTNLFSQVDEEQNRYDPSRSRFQNINNLNGLKSGLHTMDESTPISHNTSAQKSALSANNIALMSLLNARNAASHIKNSNGNNQSIPSRNANSTINEDENTQPNNSNRTPPKTKPLEDESNSEMSKFFPSDKTKQDLYEEELFKSHKPAEPQQKEIKVVKHPILKAKKKFMKFIKISAISLGAVLLAHNLTTPSMDTTGMNEQQIAAAVAQEEELSAGIGNIQLVGYKALRLYDNNVPSFFDNIFGRGKHPFTLTFLTTSEHRAVNQASLNKMLKDFPAYPEANNKFLVENEINKNARISTMEGLIKAGIFSKKGLVFPSNLENEMYLEAIQKNIGQPINQTTSYPFKYAEAGLIGTKAPADGGRSFTATGKISEAIPESVSFLKKFVAIGDYPSQIAYFGIQHLTSPLIKIQGVFNSNDTKFDLATHGYTKDPKITSVKGYREATNTLVKDKPLRKSDHQFLTEEENRRMDELQASSQYAQSGDKSLDEIIKESLKMQKRYMEAYNTNTSDAKKSTQTIDKAAVLENVRAMTQPDPTTVDEAKTNGKEMINNAQKSKPKP